MPFFSKKRRVSSGYSVDTRTPWGRSSTRVDRTVGRHGHDDVHRTGGRLRVVQLAERHDVAAGLLDPVAPGDAEVEQPVGDVPRDLLGPQDAHLVDPGIVDRRPVVDRRRAADREVGRLEQLEGGLLERALRQHDLQHPTQSPTTHPVSAFIAHRCGGSRTQFRRWTGRARRAISTAVCAASSPTLWPPASSERHSAWSRFSVVSTPKTTGTPVSSPTCWMPRAHSPATRSKCAVSPRMTAADADDGVDGAGRGERLRGQRQLERPGDPDHGHVVVRHLAVAQPASHAGEQPHGHVVVEPAADDRDAQTRPSRSGSSRPAATTSRDIDWLVRVVDVSTGLDASRRTGRDRRGDGPSARASCAGTARCAGSGRSRAAPARRSPGRSLRGRRAWPGCWSSAASS